MRLIPVRNSNASGRQVHVDTANLLSVQESSGQRAILVLAGGERLYAEETVAEVVAAFNAA